MNTKNADVLYLSQSDVSLDFMKKCKESPELWKTVSRTDLKHEVYQAVLKASVVIFSNPHARVLLKSRW